MKKLFVSIILFVTSLGFSQDWNYNFDEAKKSAAVQDKNIIIVFLKFFGFSTFAPTIFIGPLLFAFDDLFLFSMAKTPLLFLPLTIEIRQFHDILMIF